MPARDQQPNPAADHLVDELRRRFGGSVGVDQLADILNRVMDALGAERSARESRAFQAMEDLADFIRRTHADIVSLRPDEVTQTFLPNASNELDAIVEATSEATNAIMDATELIEAQIAGLGDAQRDALTDATTRIYEACGFQDITGQRIGKVVKALKEIETRIDAVVGAFGGAPKAAPAAAPKAAPAGGASVVAAPTDEDLLEGPQLKGQGRTQDEVDKLLASLD